MSFFSKWTGRKPQPPVEPAGETARAAEPPTTSKVLPKFLTALAQTPNPVLLDLGPVVGSNVAFFGEQLACRIQVEDLLEVIEGAAKAGTRATLGDTLAARLAQVQGPVDGVLCWDFFDYLDKKSAPPVAAALVKLLSPAGVLHGFFTTKSGDTAHYTRYIVESPQQFRQRPYAATPGTRTAFVTRDLTKMFEGLRITETVLLKNNVQEVMMKRTG